ncbi:cytochrome c [Planomonospora venezuelensis]|nr:FxSxx-COOH system tetratricopeptide repeat protein [Planomonospora venezuelensis]GIN00077.1 cytochrome c [Planomonospora venezuelensis]
MGWREVSDLLWLAAQVTGWSGLADEPPPPTGPPASDEPETTLPGDRPQLEPLPAAPRDAVSGVIAATSASPAEPVATTGVGMVAGTPPTVRRRGLAAALRSLRRTVPSAHVPAELDEEATAERAAHDGLWLPVFHQPGERLIDLDVVIDNGRFTLLHRAEALGFVGVLADSGAFRRVRVHLLDTDQETEDDLLLRSSDAGPPAPAARLALPRRTRRRLIVLITDGVGDAWHGRAVHRLLARWGESSTVCVVQLLPPRLWKRTGIDADRAELRNREPAAPNIRYSLARRPPGGVPVPVLVSDTGQLRSWAEFVMAAPGRWRGAAIVCTSGERASDVPEVERELSAEQRVERFRLGVSPTAFRLAVHLAAAPLTPPLMRLVQRKLVPGATGAHLAELLGSGLIRLTDQRSRDLPVAGGLPYDFVPGVREELLLSGRRSDTAQVVAVVADHLGEEVEELRGLREVIISPGSADPPELPEDLFPLVEPAVSALEAMAGPYTRPARLLKDAITGDSGDDDDKREPVGAGYTSDRDPARPEDSVYQHVAKEPLDPFGVAVNMSAVPLAPKREPDQPTPVWNIPQRNPSFTGREEMLELLHERLSAGTTAVLPEALHGLGGVGKSQIAIEYCYRHQNDYDLIWWIPSERMPVVRQAFVDLAVHLELNVSEPSVAVPAVREALRLGRPHADWLLIFDNAEDVEEIRRFFPTNGPGKIMITSRSRDWFSHAAPLEVDVFTREEGRELLRLRGPELSLDAADELCERLGYLPLAIEQAAVWLSESGMPIEEYFRLFDEKRNELLEIEGSAVPVAVAWNVSFDRLRQSHPAALQLLQVCAFFAPEPIPRSLLTGGRDLEGPPELLKVLRDPIELGRTIRAIGQYALAKVNYRDNTISLHRLVQRVVTSRLTGDEEELFRHCGHLLLANADPKAPGDRAQWAKYQALYPHVYTSRLEDCDDSWARDLCLNMIDFLYLWGDNEAYRATARRVTETWAAVLGPEHDATLAVELRLGRSLRLFADFVPAYRHHLHVRDVLRDRLSPDHERTLEAQGYLGADLRYLGRFEEALETDEHAYTTLRRRFGPDDPLTLEQGHLFAIDLRLNGDPVRARELDREIFGRKEEVLGPDHLSTFSSRAALAIDEMECGDYLKAHRLQERHTNEMRRRYQNSHPAAMDAIALLSVMSRKAGLHDESLKLSEEAMSLFQARYGERYQNTVAISLNHAVNLRHTGDLATSVEIGNKARQDYEGIFGTEHPNTPTADVNVAVSLRLMGQVEKAYELDRRALDTFTRLLGPDHPRTLVCAVNLASDLFEQEKYDQALARDRDTLQRLQRTSENHPTTLACALNLSLDLRALGQESEAATLLAETLAGYRRVLGEGHPATVAAAMGERANCDIYPIPL